MADDPLDRQEKDIRRTAEVVKNVKSLRPKVEELSEVIEASGRYADDLEKINLPGEPLLDDLKEELRKLQEFGSILKRQLDTFGQELTVLEDFVKEKFSGKKEIPLSDIQQLCQKLKTAYNTSNVSFESLNNFIGRLRDSQLLAQKLEDERGETLRKKLEQQSEEAKKGRNWGAAGTIGLAALGAGAVALGFFTGGATWFVAGAACGVGAGAAAIYTEWSDIQLRDIAAGIGKLHLIAKELASDVEKAILVNGEATLVLQSVLEFFSKDELIAQQQEKITQQQKELADKDEMIARLMEQSKQQGKI